jgi:hypothetical protein
VGRPWTFPENRHRLLQATNMATMRNDEINRTNWRQCGSVHERLVLGTATTCCALLAGIFIAMLLRPKRWREIKIHKLLFLKWQNFRETNFGVSSPSLISFPYPSVQWSTIFFQFIFTPKVKLNLRTNYLQHKTYPHNNSQINFLVHGKLNAFRTLNYCGR